MCIRDRNGLIKHYTTITEEAKVPAILYNVPSRTGCSLAASTVAYLAKNAEYVTAIKEASGDISHVADIMYACEMCIRDRKVYRQQATAVLLANWMRKGSQTKERSMP